MIRAVITIIVAPLKQKYIPLHHRQQQASCLLLYIILTLAIPQNYKRHIGHRVAGEYKCVCVLPCVELPLWFYYIFGASTWWNGGTGEDGGGGSEHSLPWSILIYHSRLHASAP